LKEEWQKKIRALEEKIKKNKSNRTLEGTWENVRREEK